MHQIRSLGDQRRTGHEPRPAKQPGQTADLLLFLRGNGRNLVHVCTCMCLEDAALSQTKLRIVTLRSNILYLLHCQIHIMNQQRIQRREYRAADFPLHNVGRELDPVDVRIARAQAAINAGHDVNELVPRRGRPLDEALDHPGNHHGDPNDFESLELIRFLLDHGADPRLTDSRGKSTPMDSCRALLKVESQRHQWAFLEEALRLMEDAVRKLEGQTLAETSPQ